MSEVQVGSVVRSTVTFTPESGTVEAADVTVKLRKSDGTEVDVTADVFAVSANVFQVDYEVAEDDPDGLWQFRWESSDPSPRIVIEDSTTRFVVLSSSFATP